MFIIGIFFFYIIKLFISDKTAPLSCQSRRTAINDRECFKPETDKSNCATEIDVVTEEVGEFDDIFSDCSDNSDSSSGERSGIFNLLLCFWQTDNFIHISSLFVILVCWLKNIDMKKKIV